MWKLTRPSPPARTASHSRSSPCRLAGRAPNQRRSMSPCPLPAAALLYFTTPKIALSRASCGAPCRHSPPPAMILLVCKPASASTTQPIAGSPASSPPNTPDSSTCSCPALPPLACRCRSAAHRIISPPRHCARSAPGIPSMSRRMPTPACGSRVSAIARA
jgi:hypothetical protein